MKKLIVGGVAAFIFALGITSSTASAATSCVITNAQNSPSNCGPYNDSSVFISSNGADLVTLNDFSNIPQTMTVTDSTSWSIDASTVGQSDQTSVKSYPATQVTYTLPNGMPDPSSDFGTTLTSSFTNTIPSASGQDFEYAADDWLADPSKASWTNDLEVMMWTYTDKQVPAGSDTGKVYTDSSGTDWEVWTAGGATTVSPVSTVTFVRKANATSGSFERFGFYNYLISQGLLNKTYGVDQLNYGLEICGTAGATQTYGVTGYSVVKDGTGPTPTPTPTPTTPTPTPTPTVTPGSLSLALTWNKVPNADHYVVKWLPSGTGTSQVFRLTTTKLSATVVGSNGGEVDVFGIVNSKAVSVFTEKLTS